MQKVTWLLRFVATGLLFGLFGLGGLLYFFPIRPYLACRYTDRDRRILHARAITHHWFRYFVAAMRFCRAVDVKWVHPERLQAPGQLIVANHPSLIDIVCLISALPNATTLVKESLLTNPFTRTPIVEADYLHNARGAQTLRHAQKEIQRGSTIVIFPEGTRTPENATAQTPPKLHCGAFALAVRLKRPITPIRITAQPRWLTKENNWWHMPKEKMVLTIEVLESIPTDGLIRRYNGRTALAARDLAKTITPLLFERKA